MSFSSISMRSLSASHYHNRTFFQINYGLTVKFIGVQKGGKVILGFIDNAHSIKLNVLNASLILCPFSTCCRW